MSDFIRVWKELDADDILKHLLVVGSVTGDCSNCKELGIDYSTQKNCPSCKTEFKYIASRTGDIARIIKRRKDLIFIDLDDYKKAMGKIKAKGLFS
ncbi:MAG: hypothetical protein ABH848_05775 [Candidatus Omnitrophota bacterium]